MSRPPKIVWLVVDSGGERWTFLREREARDCAEVWDGIHPRRAPHVVTKYVLAPTEEKKR